MIPPKWVDLHLQGTRHHVRRESADGPLRLQPLAAQWVPFTDYSDELTRATLKTDVLEIVERYKNTPGVLMFALGNESNYGLSWSSFEIENLPEGEQNDGQGAVSLQPLRTKSSRPASESRRPPVHDRQWRYPVH